MIRLATPDDAAEVAAIYNDGVANSTISFDEQAVPAQEMAQRGIAGDRLTFPYGTQC